jgi:hypothetical protein
MLGLLLFALGMSTDAVWIQVGYTMGTGWIHDGYRMEPALPDRVIDILMESDSE